MNFFPAAIILLLFATINITAQTTQITLDNQCSTPQQVLILSQERDTLLKKWIDTK